MYYILNQTVLNDVFIEIIIPGSWVPLQGPRSWVPHLKRV